jgi:hypothetical protein
MDIDIARLMAEEEMRPASCVSLPSLPEAALQEIAITAFSSVTRQEVVIDYPATSNGWVFRADLSSKTCLRWEHSSTLALVTRHATCERAVVAREQCRNCFMKRSWRKECSNKCDFFFLVAIDGSPNVEVVLANLVHATRSLADERLKLYSRHVPAHASQARLYQVLDWDSVSPKVFETERALRLRLLKNETAPVIRQRPRSNVDIILDMAFSAPGSTEALVGALEPTTEEDAFANMLTMQVEPPPRITEQPPSSALAVTPSHPSVIVSPRRDPLSPVVRATTIRRADDLATVAGAYDVLFAGLQPGVQKWGEAEIQKMQSMCFASSSLRICQCHALTTLAHRLGCSSCSWTQAMLHPHMTTLLETLRSDVELHGTCAVGVGVYRAPSATEYDLICAMELDSLILVNPFFVDIADPPGVRPVVVLYRVTSSSPLVPSSTVVPCGVIGL